MVWPRRKGISRLLDDVDYIALDIELLEDLFYEHPLFDADFYIKKGNKFIFYRKRELPITRERIRAWKDMGVKKVYLKVEAFEFYPQYLQGRLSQIMEDPCYQVERKAKILYLVSESLLERAFRELDEVAIENAKVFVRDTIRYLSDVPELYRKFMGLMEHDFTTYLHSNNVFFLATSFSLHLGMTIKEVEKISLAALFHDLGKERVDQKILQKPGSLDPHEWEEIKRHPIWSTQMLKEARFSEELVLEVVEQHHESLDGSGYPKGLKGDQIHPFSRLIKVCDVFEALCGIRPYRAPFTPKRAVEIMQTEMEGKLDEGVLKEFLAFLGYESEKD